MKGNANFPQCGFSGRAIQILKACGVDPKSVKTVNVLEDAEIRAGIKDFSNWPTIPQLYVKGEFMALGRYNGSRGQAAYPAAVLGAKTDCLP